MGQEREEKGEERRWREGRREEAEGRCCGGAERKWRRKGRGRDRKSQLHSAGPPDKDTAVSGDSETAGDLPKQRSTESQNSSGRFLGQVEKFCGKFLSHVGKTERLFFDFSVTLEATLYITLMFFNFIFRIVEDGVQTVGGRV